MVSHLHVDGDDLGRETSLISRPFHLLIKMRVMGLCEVPGAHSVVPRTHISEPGTVLCTFYPSIEAKTGETLGLAGQPA